MDVFKRVHHVNQYGDSMAPVAHVGGRRMDDSSRCIQVVVDTTGGVGYVPDTGRGRAEQLVPTLDPGSSSENNSSLMKRRVKGRGSSRTSCM